MKINWAENLRKTVHQLAESLGNLFVETFHYLALFAIGAVTAYAAVMEFLGMLETGHIKIDDILLLDDRSHAPRGNAAPDAPRPMPQGFG